jgi:hypothetical protein
MTRFIGSAHTGPSPKEIALRQFGADVATACILLSDGAECTPAGDMTWLRVPGREPVRLPTAAVDAAKAAGA